MPLTIVGACVVPLIYFFNSYFIGKLFKRFFPQYNSYFLTSLGMFVFLGLMFIFSLLTFTLNTTILNYSIILLVAQIFALFFYLINWKYSFSFERVSWKTIVICFAIALIILGSWFLSNNIVYVNNSNNFDQTLSFNSYQNALNTYLSKKTTWDTLVYDHNTDPSVIQYSSWNSLNLLWIFLFNIPKNTLFSSYSSYFASYSLLVIYAIITSTAIVGIFKNNIDNGDHLKIVMIFLVNFGINISLFLFVTNPINGLTWIVPITILILRIMYDNNLKNLSFKLDFLFAFLMISMFSLTQIFIILIIAFVIFKIIMGLLVKQQHVLSSFMVSSLGLMFVLIFLIQKFSQIGSIIYIISFIVFYSFWFIFIRQVKFKSLVRYLELFLQKNLFIILALFLSVIYVVSIILTFANGQINFNINSWIIFYNPFNIIGTNVENSQTIIKIFINIVFWLLNLSILVFCCWKIIFSKLPLYIKLKSNINQNKQIFWNRTINFNKKTNTNLIMVNTNSLQSKLTKQEIYLKTVNFENEYFVFLSFLILLVIWNPLSTNIIDKINIGWNLDVSWLFFLLIISLLFNNLHFKKVWMNISLISLCSVTLLTITTLISVYNFI